MKVAELITENIQNCLDRLPKNWVDINSFAQLGEASKGYAYTYKTVLNTPWTVVGLDAPIENVAKSRGARGRAPGLSSQTGYG